MGLSISHDTFKGPYSRFHVFRTFICQATGGSYYDKEYWYFGSNYSKTTHPGLFKLLNHSDYKGKINPKACTKIADELEALLKLIEEDKASLRIISWPWLTRERCIADAKQFIVGCRKATATKQPLEFY